MFSGTNIDLQRGEMMIGAGRLTANGNYDRASTAFNFDLGGNAIPLPLLVALAPPNDAIPSITGDVDFTAKATGNSNATSTYNVNFSGNAPNVIVSENPIGKVTFKGSTVNQMLTADLTADLDGNPQVINAMVNLGNDDLPFIVTTDFNQSPVAPFLAFKPQLGHAGSDGGTACYAAGAPRAWRVAIGVSRAARSRCRRNRHPQDP